MKIFCERLKELREEKGLSCVQLEKALGFGNSTIGKYEKEERIPNIEVLRAIAVYFGVTADYLIGLEN